jgi:hypothetical protein
MTTTVRKGAGRPAATEKSNRHAQRTPLPPKAGAVQDAKDVITEVVEKNQTIGAEMASRKPQAKRNAQDRRLAAGAIREAPVEELPSAKYGMMTVVELRKIAGGLLVKGARSMKKGDLLTAILEAETAAAKAQTPERVVRAEAKVTQALTKDTKAAAIDAAFDAFHAFGSPQDAEVTKELAQDTTSKSGAKAQTFLAEAARLGWDSSGYDIRPGDRASLTVKRGSESIDIEWLAGVFQGDTCYYHHVGRTAIKLRNASAAKMRMAIPPAQADQEAQKVTAHKSVRPKAGKAPSTMRSLPFTEASLDQEVLDALYGKEITWTNRISGEPQTERVPGLARKPSHAPRISDGPDGRVINFVGSAGFTTVLLSQITRVR